MNDDSPTTGNIIRLALVVEAGILLVALLLGWLTHYPLVQQIRVSWRAGLEGVVATLPLLIALRLCSTSGYAPIKKLMCQVEKQVVPMFEGASSLSLLLVSVFAGLGEECLFRGVLQPGLSLWVGIPIAWISTSILFGLAHLITPTYALFAGLIGAYLGATAVITDNLLVPVITHALYDFAALMYLVNPKRQRMMC